MVGRAGTIFGRIREMESALRDLSSGGRLKRLTPINLVKSNPVFGDKNAR